MLVVAIVLKIKQGRSYNTSSPTHILLYCKYIYGWTNLLRAQSREVLWIPSTIHLSSLQHAWAYLVNQEVEAYLDIRTDFVDVIN